MSPLGKKSIMSVSLESAQEYFAEELKTALEHHHVGAEHCFSYLVNLLLRSMDINCVFPTGSDGKHENILLFELYSQSLKSAPYEKRQSLQRLGDLALLLSGFFAGSLVRKVVDLGYYIGMGGNAYRALAHVETELKASQAYLELSDKFSQYSDVLNELGERANVQNNRDILRIYERWLHTGNARLKEILSENGIEAPIAMDPSRKH